MVIDPQRWAGLTGSGPHVMGVLNVTPDSFSDGGRYATAAAAIAEGRAMAAAGAAIVDVGGESTRPGAAPTLAAVEQARIVPVIRGLAEAGVIVSVDTRSASTMAAALDAGARIVNDVSALTHDPAAAPLVATRRCPVILVHMRGTPQTMMTMRAYDDVAADVTRELGERVADAEAAGIARRCIALDPGIGFAKGRDENVTMLRSLRALRLSGCPVVVGGSRKAFVGSLSGEPDPARRMAGSLAVALFAAWRGADILRVHDVAETVQALRVWVALDETRNVSVSEA